MSCGVDQHVEQMRDRRALVAADIGHARLQQRLGDREDAFAAEGLAVAELERLHFLLERAFHARPSPDSWGPNYISKARLHMRGQPQRDDREGDQDHQPDQVGDDERQYALENRGESRRPSPRS